MEFPGNALFDTLNIVGPTINIPVSITRGLNVGIYERVGGVVREVAGGESLPGRTVMWLRDGNALDTMVKTIPFPIDAARALQLMSPWLAAVNAGVTAHGLALVLAKLDVLDQQIKSVGERIDNQIVAKLKAGVSAIRDAKNMDNPGMSERRAIQGIHSLNEARQYFNQEVARDVAGDQVINTKYISMAFTALMAEGQAYAQLDEEGCAARVLREGLDDLRSALIQLMETVLARQAVYLRNDFSGQISLEFVTWLQNALCRIKSSPGEKVERVTLSDVFDTMRSQLLDAVCLDWHKKVPPVLIPAARTGKRLSAFLPFAPGGDGKLSEAEVKENLAPGLTRIAGLVEAHDRIYGQVLQLETLDNNGVDPSMFTNSLNLPNGETTQAILFRGWDRR